MFLYYNDVRQELFIDFQSILERVTIPESTLYKMIRGRCTGVRYRNKILFNYKKLIDEFPEIARELKSK